MQEQHDMNDRRAVSGSRLGLYPEIAPYRTGRLKVSSLHELYFEECGAETGNRNRQNSRRRRLCLLVFLFDVQLPRGRGDQAL